MSRRGQVRQASPGSAAAPSGSPHGFQLSLLANAVLLAVLAHALVSPRETPSLTAQPPLPERVSSPASTSTVLVAACKQRHGQLRLAMDSWLLIEGLAGITLVDWDSSPSYASTLPAYMLQSPLVNLVTVSNQSEFKLTWAFNLAASGVQGGVGLLKLDCDVIARRDLLQRHPLRPGRYYAGDYAVARDKNEEHLNGVFYALAEDFHAVGGYDERIQSYGWDDTDLYMRLNASGLASDGFSPHTLHHLYHGDRQRTQLTAAASTVPSVQYELALTRAMAQHLDPWNATLPHVLYATGAGGSTRVVAEAVPPQRQLISDAQLLAGMQYAARAAAAQLSNLVMDTAMAELPGDYLARLVSSYHAASVRAPARTLLIVHLQHGLANRLRALASAVCMARKTGRWLRVISQRDIHFDADLGDVLDLQASGLHDVWGEFDARELGGWMVEAYDYMDPRQKNAPILEFSLKHIYVRSAYRLSSRFVTLAEQDAALRALVPHPAVAALAASVGLPSGAKVIGVHVRQADPRTELPGLQASEYPEADWHGLISSREGNQLAPFVQELRRSQREDTTAVVFAAADNPGALACLREHAGVHVLDNRGCVNRSALCLQYAMADLLLLGRSHHLLGSALSAFTEVAAALAGTPASIVGADF